MRCTRATRAGTMTGSFGGMRGSDGPGYRPYAPLPCRYLLARKLGIQTPGSRRASSVSGNASAAGTAAAHRRKPASVEGARRHAAERGHPLPPVTCGVGRGAAPRTGAHDSPIPRPLGDDFACSISAVTSATSNRKEPPMTTRGRLPRRTRRRTEDGETESRRATSSMLTS